MIIWNMEQQQFEDYVPWKRFCPIYFINTVQREQIRKDEEDARLLTRGEKK